MSNSSVVYFNRGQGCLVRLVVSLLSLRRSGYTGEVLLIRNEKPPKWFRRAWRNLGGKETGDKLKSGATRARKASLWRCTPYELNLFIDADTLVLDNPKILFPDIEVCGFGVTRFSDWSTAGRRMSERIRAWEPVIGAKGVRRALSFGPAVNTGVFGWRRGLEDLKEWESLSEEGWRQGCTRRLVDEIACQVWLKPSYKIWDERWNWSVKYGLAKEPAIIHMHGNKHAGNYAMCKIWREYLELAVDQFNLDLTTDAQLANIRVRREVNGAALISH